MDKRIPPTSITIATLNCYDISLFSPFSRRERMKKLVKQLVADEPSIVCLQEIIFPDTYTLFQKTFSEAGYTVFPEKNNHFLTPSGLFTATKLPVTSVRYQKFDDQGTWFALDVFERMTGKGFHELHVTLPDNSDITIINTHLLCPFGNYFSKKPSPTAQRQYDQIVHSVSLSTKAILTGDFNIMPSNHLYTQISCSMHDPLKHSPTLTIAATNTHRRYIPGSKLVTRFNGRVDYAFVSNDLEKYTSQRIYMDAPMEFTDKSRQNLSDHFGLWTEIRLPR